MHYYYYTSVKHTKDGPHDMVTIMRRIRSGIIRPETMVSQDDEEMVPAHMINELSHFFNRPLEDIRTELTGKQIDLLETFKKGWHYTIEHQNLPVFAGTVLLLAALVGVLVHELTRNVPGAIVASFIMFMLLHNCFFAVALRLYRGQKTDFDFIEHTLAPVMGKLAFVSVIFSLMIMAGLALLVVPSIIIMLICAYMPMFILDYDYNVRKTVGMIISLLKKLDSASMVKLGLYTLFYMACIALIVPIPIIMPIMAGSLCSIYEDLSSS